MGQFAGAKVECRHCGTRYYVVPPTMAQGLPRVVSGTYLVEAEADGRWTCRVCKLHNWADELKLT